MNLPVREIPAVCCPHLPRTTAVTVVVVTVLCTERHDDAIAQMTGQIDARVRLLRLTAAGRLAAAGIDTSTVLRYAALARQAIADGLIGYRLLVAEKPAP
jgi:hypothetical protein